MPALLFALLAVALPAVVQPAAAGDKSHDRFNRDPPQGQRDDSRAPSRGAGISLDQAIGIAERRFRARVVKADKAEINGRRVYVLRLLSDEGRVWTVHVDAESGGIR